MTSPHIKKKKLLILKQKEKELEPVKSEPKKVVADPVVPVVESQTVTKAKKPKAGLVELKSQDQVVEQKQEEVKSEKED